MLMQVSVFVGHNNEKLTYLYILFVSPIPDYLEKNTTASTKPEVHNELRCRQRMAEPRPPVIRAQNFDRFRYAVFDICERTHR